MGDTKCANMMKKKKKKRKNGWGFVGWTSIWWSYLAIILDKYLAVISEKYLAVISDKYQLVISNGRRPLK